jgi:poly(hydroxyalkanoate) depolymerase family esterase
MPQSNRIYWLARTVKLFKEDHEMGGIANLPVSANALAWWFDVACSFIPGAGAGAGAGGGEAGQATSADHCDQPQPGQLNDVRAAGGNYKLYLSDCAFQERRPLVVMLHGCSQTAEDFAMGTAMNEAACRLGFAVLYPEQATAEHPMRCWNWHLPEHQKRGSGEPAFLHGLVKHAIENFSIDPRRVYVAGLSAGGAMAAILGQAYPDVFAAVGVHSGLAVGCAADWRGALIAMRGDGPRPTGTAAAIPTIVFHGDADTTVHPVNGSSVIAAIAGENARMERSDVAMAGERSFTRSILRNSCGRTIGEHWNLHGVGHAWSGGSNRGSFADPTGPNASAEMLRFFLEHPLGGSAVPQGIRKSSTWQ